jgi:hypothetical protein
MEEENKIKKFTGLQADYPSWKREFTAKMIIKELGDFMIDPHPNPPAQNAAADVVRAHNKKMAKLHSYVLLAVDERTADAIDLTVQPGDGLGAWKAVRALFERTDALRMANARAELGRCRLEEGGDIEVYLSSIHRLKNEIRGGEGPGAITDVAVISAILAGLPSSYEQWVYGKSTIQNPVLVRKETILAN